MFQEQVAWNAFSLSRPVYDFRVTFGYHLLTKTKQINNTNEVSRVVGNNNNDQWVIIK